MPFRVTLAERADRAVRHDARMSQTTAAGRSRSLDGLRGIAALAVVLHHATLLSPAIAGRHSFDGGWRDYLTYSPLHIAWAGTEAVLVFFVLSGLVLTWQVNSVSRQVTWKAYYPSRLVRLYLPVWAAVAFTALTIALVPRVDGARFGAWVANHEKYSFTSLANDLVLIVSASQVNTPLWSLRYEVLFSLLLPAYIYAGRQFPRLWPIKLGLVVVAIGVLPRLGVIEAAWMLVFALGVILAFAWPDVKVLAARIDNSPRSTLLWTAWVVASVLLLTSAFWPNYIVHVQSTESMLGLIALGAVMAVVAADNCRPLGAALTTRPAFWLGQVSFSLYLIHEPVIIATRFLLDGAQ